VGLARLLWGDGDPIGRRFYLAEGEPLVSVVGVVGDVKAMGLDDRNGTFEAYQPLERNKRYLKVAIRTTTPPPETIRAVRAAIWEIDPHLPLTGLSTATQALADSVDGPRFLVRLMTLAAAVGLIMVVVGVYGVLSFTVSQRSRDLGVHIALGARPRALMWSVVGKGLGMAVIGIALGVGGAIALAPVFQSLLFGVTPTDPATLAVMCTVMLATAASACYFPARRVTRVDPMSVLKME
jgi:predicted lysophospholipase L1 biosynthesis ABC-type transport system permease subunit